MIEKVGFGQGLSPRGLPLQLSTTQPMTPSQSQAAAKIRVAAAATAAAAHKNPLSEVPVGNSSLQIPRSSRENLGSLDLAGTCLPFGLKCVCSRHRAEKMQAPACLPSLEADGRHPWIMFHLHQSKWGLKPCDLLGQARTGRMEAIGPFPGSGSPVNSSIGPERHQGAAFFF